MTIYEFGDYRLARERFELSRAGWPVRLERKPMELLILLAERGGDLVTRAEIAQRLWGEEVFVDTEHGINTAVRKIRQVLKDDAEEPRFLHTVTGKGYRLAGLTVIKESAELVTAEVVDAAPVGSPDLPTVSGTTGRRAGVWWIAGVLVVLCIAGAWLGVGRWRAGHVARITSLAVIPLENLSGDATQEYFADGMTDELITMLAKNSTLRVTSRTSVMQYKGAHRPLREIARALAVDGILEGSISRTGDRVHMNVQLIRGADDSHIWADSYDRDATDAVSLTRDAAMTIATKLKSAVAQPVPRYVSPAAHDACLRGWFFWTSDDDEKAKEYFTKATEIQPDYALAWTGLSSYYTISALTGQVSPGDSLDQGKAAAVKAVQLDDTSALAHIAMSASVLMKNWDLARADKEAERAVELDPSEPGSYHLRAKILAAQNRHEEAIAQQKKSSALELEDAPWQMGRSFDLARQDDAALADALGRYEGHQTSFMMNTLLFDIYRHKGMTAEAVKYLVKARLAAGDEAAVDGIRNAFARGGYTAVAQWRLNELRHKAEMHYVSPVDMAVLNAELGRREETLRLLEDGYRQHSPELLWVQCEPAYDFLHGEARYRAIVKGIGLPAAW